MNSLLLATLAVLPTESLPHERVTIDIVVDGSFEARGAYPRFLGPSPLGRTATAVLNVVATRDAQSFAREARQKSPLSRRRNRAASHVYSQSYRVHVATPDLISVEMMAWRHTGGAHGLSTTTTYTWSRSGDGRIERLQLADLLADHVDARAVLSPEILGEVLRSNRPHFLDDGSVLELTPHQLERFVVTPRGLLWALDPYEVGPHSSGTFIVEIPYARLRPWLRPGNPAESVWKR